MSFEEFLISTIDFLKNIKLDQIVYGQPGKIILFVVLACLWLYIASWMYKDASYRYLEGTKTKYIWFLLGVLCAPVAWFFYILFRPPTDLDELAIQQVEERYLTFESRGLGYCARCGFEVDPDFMYCPKCGRQLRNRCNKCESLVERTFRYCPRCGKKTGVKPVVSILGIHEKNKAERLKGGMTMNRKTKKKVKTTISKERSVCYWASFIDWLNKNYKNWKKFLSDYRQKREKSLEEKKKMREERKVRIDAEERVGVDQENRKDEVEKKEDLRPNAVEQKKSEEKNEDKKVVEEDETSRKEQKSGKRKDENTMSP